MSFSERISTASEGKTFVGRNRARQSWNQVFGQATTKEGQQFPRVRPQPGGSWGRSSISEPASFKRLLQAMRSRAPGGWSDDRFEQTRHFVGVAYVAIHRICTQLSQAEVQVYQRDENHPGGKRPIHRDDPPEGDRLVKPYDLVELLQKPNIHDSFGKLMYRIGQQKRLTGTGLIWMVPNQLGVPYELYCIPTAIAIPQPAINPDYPHGYYRIQPIYPYGPFSSYPTPSTAVGAPIPAQWMLKLQYPHPFLYYDGYSPLTGLRLEMDEFESIGRSRWYKMKRAFNPDAVLNMAKVDGSQPWVEAEIERMRAEFENEQQGPENNGKLFVPPPGATIENFGDTARDMQYREGWEQLAGFILGGGFGITKPGAGMVETTTYATLWAALKQLNLITLDPECNDISSELTRHVAPFFGDDLIVEIKCKRIDDHEVNMGKATMILNTKSGTKNEVRRLMDLPITKEEWGNDMAGDPSPFEKEQQQQEQQAAMQAQAGGEGGGGGIEEALAGAAGGANEGSFAQEQHAVEEASQSPTGSQWETVGAPPEIAPAGSEWETVPTEVGGPPGPPGIKGPGNEPKEIATHRPKPGKVSRGVLPHRHNRVGKSYNKSLYDTLRKSLKNGTVIANGHTDK